MKILKKVNLRLEPMYRSTKLELNESEKEIIYEKWFKGSYITGTIHNGYVVLCKAKSARTLSIDTLEVSKVDIKVVNNCGLENGMYLQVVTQTNGGLDNKVEFYKYIV